MSGSSTEQAQSSMKTDGKRQLAAARGDTNDEVNKGLCERVRLATVGVGSCGAAGGVIGRAAGGEGRKRVRREMGSW